MLVLKSKITIGALSFDFVGGLEISKSVEDLTSSGFIELPRNIIYKKGEEILTNIVGGADPLFKRGDAVKIELGYEPALQVFFEGFVTKITPSYPLRFDIEDAMFTLKNTAVAPLNLTKTSLEDLLKLIVPAGVAIDAVDANLGNFRIAKKTTVARVLDYIKETYGLSAYINADGALHVGLAFPTDETLVTPLQFAIGKNIIDDGSLQYVLAEDQFLKITAVSIFPDNTKIQVEVGDEDGEQRTIFKYNVDKKDLETFANEQLSRLKYDGFKGTFTTFLEPKVIPGNAVQITNEFFPEKNGVYLVRGVVTTFGTGGGRQIIELDKKVE